MTDSCIYLDTYVLQQDMRVRMPKAILSNMGVEKGKTKFDIYFDSSDNSLIFRIHNDNDEGATENGK
ncbi:MAG: AbrB/MazE/SpoVT family DNA-binding domain-containing protein [Dorea sp.]